MLKLTIPYFSFEIDVDFLLTKQAVIHIKIWRWAFYTHISTSLLVLVCGVVQFSQGILRRYPIWHRQLGKMYVLLILFASGPSGLIMAFYANGGIWAKTSFVVLTLLWMYFTAKAFMEIRRKRLRTHKAFMVRSYALTLSAVTLRLYSFILLPQLFRFYGKDAYVFLAYISWLPNALIAELVIYAKYYHNKTTRAR